MVFVMKMMMKGLAAALVLMIAIGVCYGQSSSGTITGVVQDPAKALIRGAEVTITNLDTNESNTATTDKGGEYSFASLPPGRYKVTADASGFEQSIVRSVDVATAVIVTVNIVMKVGHADVTVEVTAQGTLLNQETATVNSVIDKETVLQLPYPERSALEVATLAPGVNGDPQYTGGVQSENPGITTAPNTPGASIAIAGGRPGSASQLVDGFDITLSGYPRAGVTFSKDVIQSVTVQEGFLPAQYGRNGGGIINQATASGSSQYHGKLFYRWEGPPLEAPTQGIASPPDTHQNLFTALLSGPVKIPHVHDSHTFFLAGYEPLRGSGKQYTRRRIATPQELAGQFHNSYDVLNTGILKSSGYAAALAAPRSGGIYNQFSYNVDPNGTPDPNGFPACAVFNTTTNSCTNTGHYSSTTQYVHYANDDISAQVNMNPVAKFLNALQPTPANPTPYVQFLTPDGNGYDNAGNNVISVRAVTNDDNRYSIRLDHEFGSQDMVYVRFTVVPVAGVRYDYFGPSSIADQIPTDTISSRNIAVGETHVFNGSRVNELRVSYLRSTRYRGPASQTLTKDFGASVGLTPAVQGRGFPTFSFGNNLSSIGSGGTETDGGHSLDTNFGVGDDFSVLVGRHSFKFGIDYRALQLNRLDDSGSFGGNYSFNISLSGDASGSTLASFDRGLISGYTARGLNPFHYRWKYGAAYAQDDWRVLPKLTLNLGVRYNIETPRMEANDMQGTLVPTYPGPTGAGAFVFSGHNGMPVTLWPINKKGIEPRIGFAYAPIPWISIRGSYALMHEPLTGVSNSVFPDLAVASTSYGGTTGGVQPNAYVDYITNPVNFQGVPAIATPANGPLFTYAANNSSSGMGNTLAGLMPYIEQSDKVPYIQTWTASTQFQIKQRTVAEVTYVGSHGVNLFGPVADYNAPSLNTLISQLQAHQNFSSTLYSTTSYAPCAYQPTIAGVTETLLQCDRPFQQFYNNVIAKAFNRDATSSYNALYLRVQHRQTRNLVLIASFAWSKSRDNSSNGSVDGTVTDSYGFSYPQVPYSLASEYALSTYDQPTSTKAAYVYQLPFGVGRFGGNAPRWVRAVIDHYSTTGILRMSSGVPLHVQLGTAGYFYSTTPGSAFGNEGVAEQDFNIRPNRVPGQPLIKPNWKSDPFGYVGVGYLNSAAFSIPGSQDNPQFGNIQRTLGDARTPRVITFDASLRKIIEVRDRMHFELQVDAINADNHANYFQNTSLSAHNLLSGTNAPNGSFGNLGSASTGRIIALGAAFVF